MTIVWLLILLGQGQPPGIGGWSNTHRGCEMVRHTRGAVPGMVSWCRRSYGDKDGTPLELTQAMFAPT